jgi:hypothetical protein
MTLIVDRRKDSKGKSSVNRGKFIRRFKENIREAVSDAVGKGGIKDLGNGEVSISGSDISEPEFRIGSGGVKERVYPGNDRFHKGDEVDRPQSGGGGTGKGSASDSGEGLDEFAFTLTKEEFMDLFFEDLELPNMVKRQVSNTEEFKWVHAGFTPVGVPTNLDLVRTMRGACGRRIALGGKGLFRLRELEAEFEAKGGEARLEELAEILLSPQSYSATAEEEVEAEELAVILKEIDVLKGRKRHIPFIDTFDLRFRNRAKTPAPSSKAVMFCIMDVSGSMDEMRKDVAKRFFLLLYLFLEKNYKKIDVVFVRHTTEAEEVDEETFFHSQETGGTIVSSALKLSQEIMKTRYASDDWNIYVAQASDGDNWGRDSDECADLIQAHILPRCQYYSYIEIAEYPQDLWEAYSTIAGAHPGHFAIERVKDKSQIYSVFRELFKKRV